VDDQWLLGDLGDPVAVDAPGWRKKAFRYERQGKEREADWGRDAELFKQIGSWIGLKSLLFISITLSSIYCGAFRDRRSVLAGAAKSFEREFLAKSKANDFLDLCSSNLQLVDCRCVKESRLFAIGGKA
jgi:hypothetical protein